MEQQVTKNDLVERLAEEHELTKVFARELVDGLFDTIMAAAQRARRSRSSVLAASGSPSVRPARAAPADGGEAVKIAASKSLKFTPLVPSKAT